MSADIRIAHLFPGFGDDAGDIQGDITNADNSHTFTVELAANRQDRAQGLMYRRTLAPDAGMLFDYGAPVRIAMWMKNTLIPLDMLFVDEYGVITHIARWMTPLSLETISSKGPARAVIEIKGGMTERFGIMPGDIVIHRTFEP